MQVAEREERGRRSPGVLLGAERETAKICSPSFQPPRAPFPGSAGSQAPHYLGLLSNTKNQIKYAKLRLESFRE